MSWSGLQPVELEAVVRKARLKAALLGRQERVRLGRFELLRSCGRGGEGVVYEALDTGNGTRVALKHLHAARAMAGATLQHEFRAVSGIAHPNLATLYELFHVEGQWFYSMELLAGVDFIRAARGADERALHASLTQLLRGLAALHAAGKIHRDLKPSNVLVEPGGRVVILDYGLVVGARALDDGEARESALGTAAYMAPEQAQGGTVTPAADLYAAGALLYRALVNRARARTRGAGAGERPDAPEIPAELRALCFDLLQREPGARPSAAQALARVERLAHARDELELAASAVRAAVVPSAIAAPGPDSVRRDADCFVGRVAQLRALRSAFEHTLRGEPTVVLVHGESGIGKSALLAQLRRDLETGGQARVLEGRCFEREDTPYKVIEGLSAALVQQLQGLTAPALSALEPEAAAALQRVFPAFSALRCLPPQRAFAPRDPKALRELAFSALRALVCCLRQRGPLLLIVDDLQWGDADSAHLLQHLLAPPDAPAIMLVGAYRRGEHDTSPFLRRALGDGTLASAGCRVSELALGALSNEEAVELTCAVLGTAARGQQHVEDCVRAARGIPFVLRELIVHAAQAGRTGVACPAATLNDVLRARAARCSTDARALLDVLCLAGRPLQLHLAAWVSAAAAVAVEGHHRPDAYAAAAELCAVGLTRWRDTSQERFLESYHDLIRHALVEATSEQRVRAVHARLALGMETLAIDQPEQLFQHLLASGARERAGHVALIAAERASHALAWLRAAEWFRVAIRHLPDAERRTRRVDERLGEVLAHAGRHRDAAHAFMLAVTREGCAGSARVERLAAQQLLRAGDHAAAILLIRKLLRRLGLRYPARPSVALVSYALERLDPRSAATQPKLERARPPASAERLATLKAFYAEHWLSDPLRALIFHRWLRREARLATDSHWLVAQLWEVVRAALADGVRATAHCEALLAHVGALRARSAIHVEPEMLAYARAVYLIHCRARPRDGLVLLREAEQLMAATAGSQFELGWIALLKDYALEITGHFSELVDGVLRRERERVGRDDGYSLRNQLISLPLAHIIQDRPDAGLAFLRTHWRRSERGITLTDFVAVMRVSSLLLYQGDPAAAHEALLREWGRLQRAGAFCSRLVRATASLERARSAAALYYLTRDSALRRDVQRRVTSAERSHASLRAPFRLVQASIEYADGRGGACRAWLARARADFLETQGEAGAAIADYRLAQLRRSPAAQADARDWLSRRGICNVERWVCLSSPGPAQW